MTSDLEKQTALVEESNRRIRDEYVRCYSDAKARAKAQFTHAPAPEPTPIGHVTLPTGERLPIFPENLQS
jgi:hypothetical protein